jgi:hypothetical protein
MIVVSHALEHLPEPQMDEGTTVLFLHGNAARVFKLTPANWNQQ